MELHLSTPETAFLAHELAERIGRPEEEVKAALLEILQPGAAARRESRKPTEAELDAWEKQVMEIARHCASLPVYDNRSPDEILGYDDLGLPT